MRNSKKYSVSQTETVADLRKNILGSYWSRSRIKAMVAIARAKRAARGYKIPLIATTVFVAIILTLGVVRQFQKTSLLTLISRATNGGESYSTLLSIDESEEFTQDDTTEPERNDSGTIVSRGDSAQTTSTPFTFSEETTSSSSGSSSSGSSGSGSGSSGGGGSSGSGSGSGSSGGGDSGGDDMPPPPFSASIASFAQGSTTLQCNNPSKPKLGTCSKVYSFAARISTNNGPGTVSYSWQSSQSSGSGGGSLSAGEGSAITSVSRDITLPCNKPDSFTIQFTISSPSVQNSNIISVNHNCSGL